MADEKDPKDPKDHQQEQEEVNDEQSSGGATTQADDETNPGSTEGPGK